MAASRAEESLGRAEDAAARGCMIAIIVLFCLVAATLGILAGRKRV
jgi:hypothetical protein